MVTMRKLVQNEAKVSSRLLKSDSSGDSHDFFYYGRNSEGYSEWVWHRYPGGDTANPATTYYEVQPTMLLIKSPNAPYRQASPDEVAKFHEIASRYYETIKTELYG